MAAFVQENSGLTKNEALLSATYNGQILPILKTGEALWMVDLGTPTKVLDNLLEIRISTRNVEEAKRLTAALDRVNLEILALVEQMAGETNPDKLAALQALHAERVSVKVRLEAEIAALTIYLKTEHLAFRVEPDAQNNNFPFLTRLNPGVGLASGGETTRLIGRNFPLNPTVKIGGLPATVVSSSDTEVRVIQPALTGFGARDVEINFADANKNAFLKAGYFLTTPVILKNVKPVAVTPGYLQAVWPNPGVVHMSGTSTYDENNDALSYEWKVASSPAGSSFVPGTVWRTTRSANFTPDMPGVFTFSYKTKESSTPELLESFPVVVTIEVKP